MNFEQPQDIKVGLIDQLWPDRKLEFKRMVFDESVFIRVQSVAKKLNLEK